MESGSVFFRPLGGALGAEIRGIDLSPRASAGMGEALGRALADYGVLFGCGHALGAGGLSHLAGLLGARNAAGIAPMAEPCRQSGLPSMLLLHAEEVPPGGGESIWSSLAAAYDCLSSPMRRYLATLAVAHRVSGGEETWHPLVAAHPLTGRSHLAISPDFTSRLGGVPEEEGEAILDMLRNLIHLPENQIRIPWTKDMFALWDCRLAHHYAVGGFAAAGWRFGVFCLGADPQAPPARTG